MTGKQIAENLRGTKLPWGRTWLYKNAYGAETFCVLGIKAHEHGVDKKRLADADLVMSQDDDMMKNYHPDKKIRRGLADLYHLNDKARDKQHMIEMLESPKWIAHNFPVEEFIAYLKGETA